MPLSLFFTPAPCDPLMPLIVKHRKPSKEEREEELRHQEATKKRTEELKRACWGTQVSRKFTPPSSPLYYWHFANASYEDYPAEYIRRNFGTDVGQIKTKKIGVAIINTGFKVCLFVNHITGEHSVAVEGSDNFGHWVSNIREGLGNTRRNRIGAELYALIRTWERTYGITVTSMASHSAGSAFAAWVAERRPDIINISFNGHRVKTGPNQINLSLDGDALTKFRLSIADRCLILGEGGHKLKYFLKYITGFSWAELEHRSLKKKRWFSPSALDDHPATMLLATSPLDDTRTEPKAEPPPTTHAPVTTSDIGSGSATPSPEEQALALKLNSEKEALGRHWQVLSSRYATLDEREMAFEGFSNSIEYLAIHLDLEMVETRELIFEVLEVLMDLKLIEILNSDISRVGEARVLARKVDAINCRQLDFKLTPLKNTIYRHEIETRIPLAHATMAMASDIAVRWGSPFVRQVNTVIQGLHAYQPTVLTSLLSFPVALRDMSVEGWIHNTLSQIDFTSWSALGRLSLGISMTLVPQHPVINVSYQIFRHAYNAWYNVGTPLGTMNVLFRMSISALRLYADWCTPTAGELPEDWCYYFGKDILFSLEDCSFTPSVYEIYGKTGFILFRLFTRYYHELAFESMMKNARHFRCERNYSAAIIDRKSVV